MSELRREIATFIEADRRLVDAKAQRDHAETAYVEAADALDAAWDALTSEEQQAINALYALKENHA